MTKQLIRTEIPDSFTRVRSHSIYSTDLAELYADEVSNIDNSTVTIGFLLKDKHTGGPGKGHGGVTMVLLDEAMGRAASEASGAMCVTVSLTTNFCAASEIGDFIYARAKVMRRGKNLVYVNAEMFAGDFLLATATGTWMNTRKPIPDR